MFSILSGSLCLQQTFTWRGNTRGVSRVLHRHWRTSLPKYSYVSKNVNNNTPQKRWLHEISWSGLNNAKMQILKSNAGKLLGVNREMCNKKVQQTKKRSISRWRYYRQKPSLTLQRRPRCRIQTFKFVSRDVNWSITIRCSPWKFQIL